MYPHCIFREKNILTIEFFSMKFSFFLLKKSLYIAWASFHNDWAAKSVLSDCVVLVIINGLQSDLFVLNFKGSFHNPISQQSSFIAR